MAGRFYIAALIDRTPCALIERPGTVHYQFATLGALRCLKEDGASIVPFASEEKAKVYLEDISAEAKTKKWKVFLVPDLAEASPALALGFRVRCFLDALDEFAQFEGADEDDPDYRSAKEDLANARKDLEEMDVAVAIHDALNNPALAAARE